MESEQQREESLRLQFGTASNTVGAQLYAIEKLNDGNPTLHRAGGKPRLIAFEAKGRIHRKVSATRAIHRERVEQDQPDAWAGGFQVYDQEAPAPAPSSDLPSSAYWNWEDFTDKNLFEVEEFRPHMPLHNVYEGQSASRDGMLSLATMDDMEDRLRGVLEECDNLRFIENLVDMDSSWAGLSLEVLTYLSEECPRAVVTTFGNDWEYPLRDQSQANLYSAGVDSRDRSKIEARRGINLITSVAMLVESSSVFFPVGLSGGSRSYSISGGGAELQTAARYAATTIEIALSEFRATPSATVFSLLDGILPSMKVLELSARFPFAESPYTLLDETKCFSEKELSKWERHSLLPRLTIPRSRGAFHATSSFATVQAPPPRFRRLHFRGEFDAHAPSLDRLVPENTVVHWTPEPLYIETSSTLETVDAVSQLSLSHNVGSYLHGLAAMTSRSEKRILYEFTQAGMNVDAVEELQATLRAFGDAYPSVQRTASDDISNLDEDDA